MKNVINILVAGLVLSVGLSSCEEDGHLQMEQVHVYNDSIPAIISGISTIETKVQESTHVRLILGSPDLYDATEEDLQKIAVKAGEMALKVFDSGIETGTLIITKELQQHKEDPKDGRKADMKIDSLKHVSSQTK